VVLPSYSENVNIKIVEKDGSDLETEIRNLREQVQQLRETIEYINRDRVRMKNDIESMKAIISRRDN
jgi:predicted  nucleic acid-binding Zn-ribbon protein